MLLDDATDGSLVSNADGSARDSMIWHFPHGVALESTLRIGDCKLIHNYDWRGNPGYRGELPNKDRVCSVKSHQQDGQSVTFQYDATDKSKVVRADLIYTLNGNKRDEEWFRSAATLGPDGNVSAEIPNGSTHYFLNLIDENQFLRSYPEPVNKKKSFARSAIPVRGSGE